jgi:hypothetical protein
MCEVALKNSIPKNGFWLGFWSAYLAVLTFLIVRDWGELQEGPRWGLGLVLFLTALGVVFAVGPARRLVDRSVQVKVDDHGIHDFRTGTFVRWSDFRGVRLDYRLFKYSSVATLYVTVADGEREREIAIEHLEDLERGATDIDRLVQKRGLEALLQQAAQERQRSAQAAPASEGHGATIMVHRTDGRTVKLSLSSEGLKDEATGSFIRWANFRGARLITRRSPYRRLKSETLYVTVSDDEGEREVEVDIQGLERKPEAIAQLVQRQGIAALGRQRGGELSSSAEQPAAADRPRA